MFTILVPVPWYVSAVILMISPPAALSRCSLDRGAGSGCRQAVIGIAPACGNIPINTGTRRNLIRFRRNGWGFGRERCFRRDLSWDFGLRFGRKRCFGRNGCLRGSRYFSRDGCLCGRHGFSRGGDFRWNICRKLGRCIRRDLCWNLFLHAPGRLPGLTGHVGIHLVELQADPAALGVHKDQYVQAFITRRCCFHAPDQLSRFGGWHDQALIIDPQLGFGQGQTAGIHAVADHHQLFGLAPCLVRADLRGGG